MRKAVQQNVHHAAPFSNGLAATFAIAGQKLSGIAKVGVARARARTGEKKRARALLITNLTMKLPNLATDRQVVLRVNQVEGFMPNPFVHLELMATDAKSAKSFYGQLFDWEMEDLSMENLPPPDKTYTMIKVGEGTGGGIMKNPMPNAPFNAPSSWLAYVLVDDLAKSVEKAKSLGATIMKDKTEVKGMGAFAIITDPVGAMLGLWESKK
jgi:uncharacterized protein